MTIPSTARKAGPLLGTGVQTAWPFTFKVFAAADVAVTIANSSGVETLLVLNTDYSVTLNANQETSPGGTVTYPISGTPLAVGSVLSIVGDLDYDQPLDLPSGGNFSPLALENQLDRTIMQVQQLREVSDRTLTLPVTSTASTTLPAPEADKVIGWNHDADGLVNVDPALFASVTASAYVVVDKFTGDGTTTQFVCSQLPGSTNAAEVTIAGVMQNPAVDYTVSGARVVFTSAPANGTVVIVRFLVAASQSSGSAYITERQVATAGQTAFTLANAYAPGAETLSVFVNGLLMSSTIDYAETSANVVTFTSGLALNDEVVFHVWRTNAIGVADSVNVAYSPAGTGAVATTVQTKLRESVSVKDFGAVGDGITDDTAAIELCIVAAGVGKTILLPAGMNCLVSSEVDLNVSGQKLSGYGAKITKAASFTGSCVLRIGATSVTLEGLEVDGTDKVDDGIITTAGTASGFTARNLKITNCAYGISANSNSNVAIENCDISLVASGAIRAHNIAATSAQSRVRILRNRIDLSDLVPATTTQNALLVRGDATYPTTDAHVIGNTIIHAADPTSSAALCCEMRFIDGGVFSDNFGKDGSMLVSVAGSNDVKVDGNVCDGATFYGIEIAGVSAVPNKNIVVSDNTINGRERLNYAIGLQGAVASCSGVSITGNSIRGCTLYGIFSNENWSDIDITGNRIDITATAAGQRGVYILGTATAVNHVAITGNVINGNNVGEKAVHLRSVLYATVTGNVCQNWTESGVYIDGSSATCDEISVVGNSFRGLSASAIGVLGTIGDKVTAYGNTGYRLSGTTNINALNLNAALYEAWGTGTPEAAVTAGVGSVFHRTNGGALTCLYIKETGTGNTGWVAK